MTLSINLSFHISHPSAVGRRFVQVTLFLASRQLLGNNICGGFFVVIGLVFADGLRVFLVIGLSCFPISGPIHAMFMLPHPRFFLFVSRACSYGRFWSLLCFAAEEILFVLFRSASFSSFLFFSRL